jgi:hypothetical protein
LYAPEKTGQSTEGPMLAGRVLVAGKSVAAGSAPVGGVFRSEEPLSPDLAFTVQRLGRLFAGVDDGVPGGAA